jgi:ABC-type multidrug transport system fused ATPase/permease subunit
MFLIGFGAWGIAASMAQEQYLLSTCYRDLREAALDEWDPDWEVEKVDEMGWSTGRDLRETLQGGEITLALLGIIALGLLAATFALGFFATAAIGADALAVQHANWTSVITWSAGIIAGLFSLSVLIGAPLGGLKHWFTSRRLIERAQMDALRVLAAAARRDD